MAVQGIDVSHWQGEVDWEEVSRRCGFAFAKASEGVGYVDPRFQQNYAGIREAGMFRGASHFARVSRKLGHTADSFIQDAESEADHFLDTVGNGFHETLPPVLDIGWDKRARGIGPQDMSNWCLAWLEYVENATGVVPMVYLGQNFWRLKLASTNALFGYHLWLAQPRANSAGTGPKIHRGLKGLGWPWMFWQYTHKGKVKGVHGRCDRNIFPGTKKALGTFIRGLVRPDPPQFGGYHHADLSWSDRLICWTVESFSDRAV